MKRFKVPLRNLLRNKRRTAFSMAIIALGVAILLATLAFTDEAINSTKRSLSSDTGTIQIAAPELFAGQTEGFGYLIGPEKVSELSSLIEQKPEVAGVTSRLEFGGLISYGDSESTVLLRGVVPENCVQDYSCIIEEGEKLNEQDKDGLVLGKVLAENLGVRPGDAIDLSYSNSEGNYRNSSGEVIGLASLSSRQLEGRIAFSNLSFTKELLGDEGVGRIIVRLNDINRAEEFAAEIEKELDERGYELATRTWKELSPLYSSLNTFWNAFTGFTYVAVFTLVFFSTLEVLTMSFLERSREVGTVRAIGATRWEVFRDFLVEGVLVGLFGGLVGLALGGLISLGVNLAGITWKPPGATIPEPLKIGLTYSTVLFPLLAAVVSTLLGSILPAWQNSRTVITESLRKR